MPWNRFQNACYKFSILKSVNTMSTYFFLYVETIFGEKSAILNRIADLGL